jgi:hypothetical protein
MTKADELNALADRCEREEGGAELNARIFEAVYTNMICRAGVSLYDYTESLDAAVSLVPKDYDWIVCRANGGLTLHACVGDTNEYFSSTPALALCAAALRARAALSQTEAEEAK